MLHRADFSRQNNIVFIGYLELVAQHVFLFCPEDEFTELHIMNDDFVNFLIGSCGIWSINIFALHTGLLCIGSDCTETGKTECTKPVRRSLRRQCRGLIAGWSGAGLGTAIIFDGRFARAIRVSLVALGRMLAARFGGYYLAASIVSSLRDNRHNLANLLSDDLSGQIHFPACQCGA